MASKEVARMQRGNFLWHIEILSLVHVVGSPVIVGRGGGGGGGLAFLNGLARTKTTGYSRSHFRETG